MNNFSLFLCVQQKLLKKISKYSKKKHSFKLLDIHFLRQHNTRTVVQRIEMWFLDKHETHQPVDCSVKQKHKN